MQMHDDLATLFSRNLSLQPVYHDKDNVLHQTAPPEQAITYSITQHYHHSSHVAKQPPRPASEASMMDEHTLHIILARHGVDVNTLFPSQVQLFRTAEPEQQMRLVELWRICPPNSGGHVLTQDVWYPSETTFDREEGLAKLRYERQMVDERAARSGVKDDHMLHMDAAEEMMSDGEQSNAPLTPIQNGDGRWPGNSEQTEPYMLSGYESLAQKEYDVSATRPSKDVYSHFGTAVGGPSYRAVDPVYNAPQQQWGPHAQEQQMAMENQYGAFTQGVGFEGYSQDEEML